LVLVGWALVVRRDGQERPLGLPMLLVGGGLALLLGAGDPLLWLAAAVLFLAGAARFLRFPGAAALPVWGALVLMLQLLYRGTEVGPWVRWSAQAWGSVFGLRLGSTFLGFWEFALLTGLLVARWALVEWRPRRLLCAGLFLFASHLLYLALLIQVPASLRSHSAMTLGPPLALILGYAAVFFFLRRDAAGASEPARPRARLLVALPLTVGLFALCMTSFLVEARPAPRVLLYSVNEGPILDWSKPTFGSYGPYAQGMFGLLPEYLRADGFEVDFLREPIRREHLQDVDALVTINVDTDWQQAELLTVWDYVEAGGNLLVLGDHTDIRGSATSQNSLLAPMGIEFRFDGAIPPASQGWRDADLLPGGILAGVDNPNSLGIGVGASLALSDTTAAKPVLLSRLGLSDLGDALAEDKAFLGDYEFQWGEQLGDLVLAARCTYGAGKVLVFGDTSSFQNPFLMEGYEALVGPVFRWISGDVLWDLDPLVPLFSALCLAGVFWILRQERGRPLILVGWSGAVLAVFVASQGLHQRLLQGAPLELPYACLDLSHGPRIDFSNEGKNSIGAFLQNLQRNGYFVHLMEEFSSAQLRRCQVFITVAPVESYSRGEVTELCDFAEEGGLIVAACGYFEKEPLGSLLQPFGLDVGSLPVGPIPLHRREDRARAGVEFIEAWPILRSLDGSGQVSRAPAHHDFHVLPQLEQLGLRPQLVADQHQDLRPADVEVFASYRNVPLAVLKRCGRGGIFLVGDSYFFSTRNLEDEQSYCEPNILLLRRLLSGTQAWGARS
jgi:hypothetical protein